MKTLTLTLLVALLVVATVISIQRWSAANPRYGGGTLTLVAIGTDPVPLPPPPPKPTK